MDVINEIIEKSALSALSIWSKSFVLLLFSTIVLTLMTMLGVLLLYGSQIHIQFGY